MTMPRRRLPSGKRPRHNNTLHRATRAGELQRYADDKMSKQLKQLCGLTLVAGCTAVVVSALLCGCQSEEEKAEAYFQQADALLNEGRHVDAIAAYKKAIALKPDYADAHFGMGMAYGSGQEAEAIAAYKKALAIKPDYPFAHHNMAGDYYELGRHTEALAAYKKAIALDPDFALTYRGVGRSCRKLKLYTKATAAFEKAIVLLKKEAEDYPDSGELYYDIGLIYRDLEQQAEATAAFQKAIVLYKKELIEVRRTYPEGAAYIYLEMGDACYQLGQYADAITAYKKCIADEPTWNCVCSAYFRIAVAHKDLKQYPDAIAAFRKAIAMLDDAVQDGSHHAYVQIGDTHNTLKQHAEAIAACKKAIDLKPDYGLAYLTIGDAYRHLKQNKLAIAAYKKGVALKTTGEKADLARRLISELSTTQPIGK